jgi:hypothetical protein
MLGINYDMLISTQFKWTHFNVKKLLALKEYFSGDALESKKMFEQLLTVKKISSYMKAILYYYTALSCLKLDDKTNFIKYITSANKISKSTFISDELLKINVSL